MSGPIVTAEWCDFCGGPCRTRRALTRAQMIDEAVRRTMRYFDISPTDALSVAPFAERSSDFLANQFVGNIRAEFSRIAELSKLPHLKAEWADGEAPFYYR